jgi:hypothetical protein
MEEKEIIAQFKALKQIKPDQGWVGLAKARILGEKALAEKQSLAALFNNLLFQYRMALASLAVIGLAGGTFIFAQGALPGDALYSVKLAAEKSLAMLADKDQKPAANLQLAEKRLEELNAVTRQKRAENLPEAIKEFKDAKATAKKEMAVLVRENPEKATKIAKEMVASLKSIDTKELQVNAMLGLEADEATSTTELAEGISDDQTIVSVLIANAETTALTDDQKNDLVKIKELYDRGRYEKALETYVRSSLAD